METIFYISEILIAALLILLIVLQAQGSGIGGTFGGGGEFYRSKRGIEKVLFRLTILLVVLFALNSIITVIITR
ncbi:preprotein translocase subunit SecG [Candidatus Microgenomates bacterium]|nr:preprotein translocase subunit SecG [Candidatus Microgenomates bacterium]MBI2622260.1 preprotein translocase subunit SecG [Candidatus Microgenomates bacterium]